MELHYTPSVSFSPTFSSSSSLLGLYAQEDITIESGQSVAVSLGVAFMLPKHTFLQLFVCGHLRRKGARLTEGHALLTPGHNKGVFSFPITNSKQATLCIAAGEEVFHGYLIRAVPITAVNHRD